MKNNISNFNKDYFISKSNYNKNYFIDYKNKSRLAINNFFVNLILKFNKNTKQTKTLDIGFGNGSFFYSLLQNGYNVQNLYGIDMDYFMINNIKEKINLNAKNLDVVDIQKNKSKFDSNFFDVIASFDVIEHLNDDVNFLLEINRILKNGGLLLVQTPVKKSLFYKIKKDEDQTHINLKTKQGWEKTFTECNFNIIESKSILFYNLLPFLDKIINFKTAKPLFAPSFISQEIYFILKKTQ